MSGWILRDESSKHRFRFPDSFTMEPGAAVRIRSGCGTSDASDLYWCADDAVWSNGGDSVILQTSGGTVVDRWKYEGDF
jgi:micrococcal nuclease